MCEKKRRALQKDEKHVRYGHYAFQRFYKLSAGAKKDKTYEDFCNSQYYNAFVKFGSFLNNVKPLYPEKYIDWVVTSGVKLERSVQTMMDWASENEPLVWNHYFRYVSLNRAVWHIKDGKISPWLILNTNEGKTMLSKLSDEQLDLVYHVMNPEHWAMRFKRNPNDVQLVKEVAKESNL